MRFKRATDGSNRLQLHFGWRYFGGFFEVMRGSDDRRYLTGVLWALRPGTRLLRYVYPSMRLPG